MEVPFQGASNEYHNLLALLNKSQAYAKIVDLDLSAYSH